MTSSLVPPPKKSKKGRKDEMQNKAEAQPAWLKLAAGAAAAA